MLTRASDWVNYDRAALNTALLDADQSPREFVGATLRSFWREYDGVTRLHATLIRHLTRGFSFVLTGDNLLAGTRKESRTTSLCFQAAQSQPDCG